MGDQQSDLSYYQIGGFRPNVTLQGCSTSFFLLLNALFKGVVMLLPERISMTCASLLKSLSVQNPQWTWSSVRFHLKILVWF